ncbi:MAG TPA: c-type cytochrome [Longimicrobiales bacterium]|nr:c-type cytochrome [Longimicrobiales bacterium]
MRAAVVTMFALFAATSGLEAQSAGQKIFQGKGLCYACHGKDARGTPLAPNLTDGEWLNIDGSLPAIVALIKSGVPKPVKHPAPMPPMGGAKLSKDEIDAVAAYVKGLSSQK